jgi:alanine racemase
MGRIGILPDEVDAFLDQAAAFPNVRLDGLLSHFANADLADQHTTAEQVRRFRAALQRMEERGVKPRWRHLSNSAGVLSLPEVRDGAELNLVRPGLMLYGPIPSPWLAGAVRLQPVLSWKTAVTHLKWVPRGTPVSYGGTWVASRESLIATLPVGYADGYSRRYSNRAEVLIRGRRARIAGRVCMDMCMVDVTDTPGVALGDEAVLLGAQGAERIWADDLAKLADTISYEVLCAIGARVPRFAR